MLDPHRIGLNAESIGFQKRMLQDLDYEAMHKAMQTDYNNQNSAVQVRREREAAQNEIRVMGGQLSGFESNELLLTYARQQRQINGYPLRQFDSNNPAVVLPRKYGGFPLYNRNQTEYPELVSVFTEPMSAPLQRDTELLGRAGAVAMSNDLNEPYSALPFVNPMTASMDMMEQNKNVFKQRQHLQRMSDTNKRNKGMGGNGEGIIINRNGTPTTTGSDAINNQVTQEQTFGSAVSGFQGRVQILQSRETFATNEAPTLRTGALDNELGMMRGGRPRPQAMSTVVSRVDESQFEDLETDISYTRAVREELPPSVRNDYMDYTYRGTTSGPTNGLQPMSLKSIGTPGTAASRSLSPFPSTKRDKRGQKYKGVIKQRWEAGDTESAQRYMAAKRVNRRINFASPGMMAGSPRRSPGTPDLT